MKTYRVWYLLVPIMAILPAGTSLLWWQHATLHANINAAFASAGQALFVHEWQPNDPLCADGDGLGPVFNARSCVACHNQRGPGGGGDLRFNVTTFTLRQTGQGTREGVVHSGHTAGVTRCETLQDVHPALPAVSSPTLAQVVALPNQSNHCLSFPAGVHISQRNTPALFGSKLIDEIPERVILASAKAEQAKWGMAPADGEELPVGRAPRLASGRIGRIRVEGPDGKPVRLRSGRLRQRTWSGQPRSPATHADLPDDGRLDEDRSDAATVRRTDCVLRVAPEAGRAARGRDLRCRRGGG